MWPSRAKTSSPVQSAFRIFPPVPSSSSEAGRHAPTNRPGRPRSYRDPGRRTASLRLCRQAYTDKQRHHTERNHSFHLWLLLTCIFPLVTMFGQPTLFVLPIVVGCTHDLGEGSPS